MVARTLTKQNKSVTVELGDDPRAFVDTVAARLKAGYVPVKQPIGPLAEALRPVGWYRAVKAFAPSEQPAVLAIAMKDKRLHSDLLRTVVTPELIAHFAHKLEGEQQYRQEDLIKALAFAAKKPEAKAIIQREVPKLELDDERLEKQLVKLVAKLGAPPKVAPSKPAKPAGNEAALLAAIAAEPESDEPRRVYADWLIEHGVGFGEYIIAALGGSPEAKRLETKHAKAWLAPIRPFIRRWGFERGMLERVEADAQAFVEAADAIADRAPRGGLVLEGLKARTLAALAKAPLGRFAALRLSSQRITDAGAALLAGSPNLVGVEGLYLDYNHIGDAGAIAFATSPYARTLNALTLANSLSSAKGFATAEGIAALMTSKKLPKLDTLTINVRGPGIAAAVIGTKLPLRTLVLSGLSEAEARRIRAAHPKITVQT